MAAVQLQIPKKPETQQAEPEKGAGEPEAVETKVNGQNLKSIIDKFYLPSTSVDDLKYKFTALERHLESLENHVLVG